MAKPFSSRAAIECLFPEGNGRKEIYRTLQNVFKEEELSYNCLKFWTTGSGRGRKFNNDEQRSGRPALAASKENVVSVEKIGLQNRGVSVAETMREAKLTYGTTERICFGHGTLAPKR
ncbi:hypothetical protein M514_00942 [Trichuris suis]|uniref:Mos1 transposase HTH domain-containing protein n=1 Tax=Trichuris suis TaxID=68888 RepID=A0A085MLT3_9BILA|nr:hypothetical protein M513_00942 [Trichuris suis]KFD70440.1 hypothetical protein M514_00942 [Trichuris suis]